jgi:hypothetical protein
MPYASRVMLSGSGPPRTPVSSAMRPPRSCGVAEVVGCGSSGDGRESPAQLLELAFLRVELGLGFRVLPELPELERECLDPPHESGELRASALRLGRAEGTSCDHERSSFRAGGCGGAARTRGSPGCLGRLVERRLFLDDRGGGLTFVGSQERHEGRRENDAGPDQERLLVAVGGGLSEAVAGAQD